ncbi:hypothetical protein J3E68DRAFT_451321 [Trichoderma sp. SZMC 28012]
MRLGQGYNSFLQLPCVDGTVKIDQSDIQTHVARADPPASVPQVNLERISDVARGMNVSAASSIKSGTIGISGNSLSVDEAKFADSDLNAVISVKVINQTTTTIKNPEFLELNRKMNMTNETFFQTFGDCYISGFIEGGDLHGIVSIKAPDATKKANIEAALNGVMSGSSNEFKLGEEFASSSLEAALRETETTITVNWSGGGQIKPDEEEWTLESLLRAASGFPARVATCPQKTWAVLTPYTQNQSFVKWAAESKICVPTFSHIEQYTHSLLDSYMLYKRHLALLQTAMRNPLAFRESKCDNHISLDVHSLIDTRKDIKYEMSKIVKIIDSLNQDPNGIITTEIESAETWAARLPLLGN